MAGPLSHLRVLDLSRIMAGPWAGQILADLGAAVIKVERSGVGDDTRKWGPPYLKDRDGRDTSEPGYYLSVNRGKRSVELDLASVDGQAAVKALAARSDILLENFRSPEILERLGLGWDREGWLKEDWVGSWLSAPAMRIAGGNLPSPPSPRHCPVRHRSS